MKKLKSLATIFFAIFSVIALNAQTVDEVIEKNITAMGGKEKLATINSVRKEGNLNIQGTDVSIISTILHGVGSRADISINGTENYQIATMSKGIIFMPVQGMSDPTEMPADLLKAGQIAMDLKGIFVNYKEKGIQVELAGKETVDGMECYKIKVVFKNGNNTNYFIDSKTDRLFKTTTRSNVNGEEVEIFTIYTNYKQNADGYWFAYTTTTNRGETNYDKIETNIKVDEGIFK
jgi:hypothetical protein